MRILALVPAAASASACLDLAEAAVAGLPDAQIDVLHVVVDPTRLIGAAEEIDLQFLRQATEGTADQRLEAARAATQAWMQRHPDVPVMPEWNEVVGGEVDMVCAAAASHDILVVPRSANMDGGDALFAAFYRAERPFFLAPHEGLLASDRPLTGQVVLAWNGTPACRRATEAALPWLRLCQHPVLMTISGDKSRGEDMAADLRGSGIPVVTRHLDRDRETLGDQIVTEAKVARATLLVMGAYRHGAWIEWLVGHTTNQAIRHEDIAFLMSH